MAQLLEECPLFDLTDDAFPQRMEMVELYFDTLHEVGAEVSLPMPAPNLYETFVLQRTVFGIAFTRAHARQGPSSQSLRQIELREDSFWGLLSWQTQNAQSDRVRGTATLTSDLLSTAAAR